MWFCKKKKKPEVLSITASQAAVIAQLQQNQLKFERQKSILNNILSNAKRGSFEAIYYDKSYYHMSGYDQSYHLHDSDIEFLKGLGYTIEVDQQLMKHYPPTNSAPIPYNRHIIKW